MDESTTRGIESLELEDRECTLEEELGYYRVCVEGYDNSLRGDELESVLVKHFAGCGTVGIITNLRDYDSSYPNRSFVTMLGGVNKRGENKRKKALERNGRDMGGWNAVVTPFPYPQPIPELVDWVPPPEPEPKEVNWMIVMGFDTSLPKDDIKSSLIKHFSSCGEITETVKLVSNKKLKVLIEGEGGLEKSLNLTRCECDVKEGCKIAAKKFVRPRRLLHGCTPGRCPEPKRAKMTKE